jgi:predicted aspartyl protease
MLTESQVKRVKEANKGWVLDKIALAIAEEVGVEKVIKILEAQPGKGPLVNALKGR